MTEKTNEKMAARRDSPLVSNCNQNFTQRNLKCLELTLEEREHVRHAFYDLADFEKTEGTDSSAHRSENEWQE